MALETYREKRDLNNTPEPEGGTATEGLPRFVVQLHRATRLHHDFRLENEGVLKSWAVPKGPSMNPDDKRLAMMVEDHPMDYRAFEGIIPKGNYGAGTVMVWDEGTFAAPEAHNREEIDHAVKLGLHKGHVAVFLDGQKLRGLFDLIKIKGGKEENAWLLVKRPDEFATTDPIEDVPRSAVTGRTLEEIRDGAPASGQVWYSDRIREDLQISDAPQSEMPRSLKPMLAVESEKPFDRPGWLFEIKWDGYRTVAEVELEGDIRLCSRNGLSFNERYPEIVADLKRLGHAAVLDGEIVAVDDDGISQFQWLQDWGKSKRGTLLYYVFDLLYLDGHDLQRLPLHRRKELLRQILPDTGRIRMSDHVETRGTGFFDAVRDRGLEGMVAKEADSVYEPGRRSKHWVKVKCLRDQLAVIGGYTAGRNSRKHFGALVLGVYEGDIFTCIGHTGGGFDDVTLHQVMERLEPLRRDSSPFEDVPKTNMPVTWVDPQVVCEVTYRGWTESGLLRQPVFKHLVDDLDPHSVRREDGSQPAPEPHENNDHANDTAPSAATLSQPAAEPAADSSTQTLRHGLPKSGEAMIEVGGHHLKVTNLDKVLWPGEGITKGDLIAYYRAVSTYILPYLKNRPESLHRHPNGIGSQSFFQKDMPSSIPKWLETVDVFSGTHGGNIRYLLCQDEATLVYMANLACIELNPWNSSVPHLDQPDYTVVDLDPHEVGFDAVVKTAQVVKQVLDELGAEGYPKTSGATGIHIFIPLAAQYSSDQARQFAELVASVVHSRLPQITSLERSPAKRVGKVYVDFLQNRDGQTLASVYSVRPKPGATVSTPLEWDEVTERLDPKAFTIRTVLDRLERVGDLWAPVLGPGIDMASALGRLGG